MGYLILGVLLVLIVLMLPTVMSVFSRLDTAGRLITFGFAIAFLVLGAVYSLNQEKSGEDNLHKILAFNEGKTLQCNEIEVDKEHFNFVSGTLTFISKDPNKREGLILELKDCRIKAR